jgi:hypothetical protein
MVGRRGELLVELFLEELSPAFLVQSTEDFAYDYLAGFTNRNGGVNTFAVKVKATEQPIRQFRLPRSEYTQLASSNTPALLMVADVKHNQLFYARIEQAEAVAPGKQFVEIPLAELNDQATAELRTLLAE